MTPHTLTETQYQDALYRMILMLEESGDPKETAYTDQKGIPTIGVGINLRVATKTNSHIQTILETAFAIDTTQGDGKVLLNALLDVVNKSWPANLKESQAGSLHAELNQAMEAYHQNHPEALAAFTLTEPQIRQVFNVLIEDYSENARDFLTQYNATQFLQKSSELLALTSLSWANPSLLGKNLGTAFQNGNRAEAWYQIRYESNGGASESPGIAKRRYYESEVFGLMNPDTTALTISDAEAKQIMQMYTRHKPYIQTYEGKYGIWEDKAGTQRDAQGRLPIFAANQDYGLSGDAAVDTLYEALNSARQFIIKHYVEDLNQGLNTAFDGNVLVGNDQPFTHYVSGSAVTDSANDITTLEGTEKNDLILGLGGNDKLTGGAGNDILIGGAGKDALIGGAGNDTYILGGAGESVISDNDVIVEAAGEGTDLVISYVDNVTLAANVENLTLADGPIVNTLIRTGRGNDLDNIIKGSAAQDQLIGEGGNDTLYGNDGAGGDVLDGGTGYDKYYADDGDTIIDADGKGEVWFNGKKLTFAVHHKTDAAHTYTDKAGNIFTLNGSTLTVNDPLTVEGFSNGQLGIYLDEEDDPKNMLPVPFYEYYSYRLLSPLALDLNGNGKIDDIGLANSSVYFDLTNDGIAEMAGWLAPEDGLLAIDLNGNGGIDNRDELFGADLPRTSFDRMRELIDTNHDGAINAVDLLFAQLRVWQDANSDGISQAGELRTLNQLGITSIDANATAIVQTTSNGNNIIATAGFTRNGQQHTVVDIEFAYNPTITNANPNRPLDQDPILDADIYDLPWLRGYGLVKSLHLAYQENPQLRQAAMDLIAQGRDGILQNFDGFMAQWTGLTVAHAAHNVSRTTLITEDKVWMLENLTGQIYMKGTIEAANFGVIYSDGGAWGWRTGFIQDQYQTYASRAALSFVIQATAKDWLPGAYYSLALDRFVATDAASLQAGLQQHLSAISNADDASFAAVTLARLKADGVDLAPDTMKQMLTASPYAVLFNAALDFTGKNVWLQTNYDNRQFSEGRPIIEAGRFVVGISGDQILYGGRGNDVLAGGSGTDSLQGDFGNDTYCFNLGDGRDSIYDEDYTTGNVDTVEFGAGILPGDVKVSRDWSNLYLGLNGGTDRLNIQKYFVTDACKIEQLKFADGTVWGATDIQAMTLVGDEEGDALYGTTDNDTMSGLGGDDKLYGGAGDDTLEGGADNDTLYGDAGNDTLIGGTGDDYLSGDSGNDHLNGGAGNDYLSGYSGNDTYCFNLGDGQDRIYDEDYTTDNVDTVELGTGILPGDVRVARDRDSLYLDLNNGVDRLTLSFWVSGGDANKVEQVQFADGTVWDAAALWDKANTPTGGDDYIDGSSGDDSMFGLEGNDTLYGGAGNDTLDGGSGSDQLFGGAGDDTYLLGKGSGRDYVYDESGSDVMRFASNIKPEDVALIRDTYRWGALTIALNGTDKLTFNNVERLEFQDGTVWDGTYSTQVSAGTFGTDADDIIDNPIGELTGSLYGFGGNDNLTGGDGNDLLDGGAGDDMLYGGTGDDVYLFGKGSGQDHIHDFGVNTDVIRLKAGVSRGDIDFWRDAASFYLKINATGDTLTVAGWNYGQNYRIERIEFSDGTVLDQSVLNAAAYLGTGADDVINGSSDADTLRGLGGNDTLNGSAGDDVLDGGTGNDVLDGGAGNDVYVFGRGHGQDRIYDYDSTVGNIDTVRLEPGIFLSDVSIWRDNNNLYLKINTTDDVLTVSDWSYRSANRIERIEFSDGTVLDQAALNAIPLLGTELNDYLGGSNADDAIQGLGGDDYLSGGGGNDGLDGGIGNDTLSGGAGNDVYIYGRGYGQDTIKSYDDGAGKHDVIRFSSDITPADVLVRRSSDDLILKIQGSTDQLTVQSYFSNVGMSPFSIEAVEFFDGTSWDLATIKAMSLAGTTGDDLLFGFNTNDVINGNAGDDSIYAQGGNDVLNGGGGNDYLSGGEGNDIYTFGLGFGQDVVFDYDEHQGNVDTVRFAMGVSPADASLMRYGDSIALFLNGGADRLTLQFWFGGASYKVERVEFADGTVWDEADLAQAPIGLLGTESSDGLYGSFDDETIYGMGGDDTIRGSGGNDTVYGGGGNDNIQGSIGNDLLQGDAGNDTFADFMGNDTYVFGRGDGQDTIYDTDTTPGNVDVIRFKADIAPEDVTITRGASGMYLHINGSQDRILLSSWFDGDRCKFERVEFADGTAWGITDVENRIVRVPSTEGDDEIFGGSGADVINGLGGNDYLFGDAGDDALDGGTGDDYIEGGTGNDVYLFRVGSGSDIIQEDDQTEGNVDTISLQAGISATDVILSRDYSNLSLTLSNSQDRLTVQDYYYQDANKIERIVFADGTVWDAQTLEAHVAVAAGTEDVDAIYGSGAGNTISGLGGDDYIDGDAGNDILQGNAGDDYLMGGAGNDTLDGGAGSDTLLGGVGDDTYFVDNMPDIVTENLNEGKDLIQSGVTYTLSANVENLILTGTTAINGTGNELNNSLTGNTAANTLNGGLGNDTLNGRAGADTLIGGLGDDIYIVDNTVDIITEAAGEGTDTVQSSVTYILSENVENLTLASTGAINGTGNGLNNVLTGNTGANILNGGAGTDTLIGGDGNDTYVVDNVADVVTETNAVLATGGNDLVQASVTYTLSANVEKLTLTGTTAINGTGNELNNVLTGNAAANTLEGGQGNDTLTGGDGNDTLYGGSVIDAPQPNVINQVVISAKASLLLDSVAANMAVYIDGVLKTSFAVSNTATYQDYVVDPALLGMNAHTIDIVFNNDAYIAAVPGGAAAQDRNLYLNTLTVNGTAMAASSNSVYLDSGSGAAAFDGLNLLANQSILSSNSAMRFNLDGNDVLDGGIGADTLVGGYGNDTYIVDNAGDVVTEAAGAGIDTIQSSISIDLANYANVENVSLTGTSAINAKGNSGSNTLTGNAADNLLDGGAGADRLTGGTGNDTYIVDNAADVVVENAGQGTDTIQSSVGYTASANVENLTLTGTGAINGTGNALGNLLTGNTGNNTLNGAGGNDLLQGMAGNDTLSDTIGNGLFDGGAGTDTLTGGTGNELFIGGLGNDTLTTGTGYDVIAFNKGDGADTLNASTGADNTLSLGGGIKYADLSLTKSGTDLILKAGATDQITLKGWYSAVTNHSVLDLQVIADAMSDFSLGGSDVLRNNKVEHFDFANLVADFDAAGATANWALTDARLTARLKVGSDTEAIGGDLAYQYGKAGSLTGIGLNAAQSVINAPTFGQSAQTLNAPGTWSAELVKLG